MTKQLKKLLPGILHEKMDKQKTILDIEFEQWRGKYEQVDEACEMDARIN